MKINGKGVSLVTKYQGYKREVNGQQWDANHFKCTLRHDRREYTFDYYMGVALSGEPTVKMVMDSLVLDADSYENAGSFENFCAEFGYDTDSRKAEAIYKECGKTAEALKRVFNTDIDTLRGIVDIWNS